jgi:hypothetical protein
MKLPNKTNAFIRFLKPLLPENLRIKLRKFHQKGIFKKAIRDFRIHYTEIEKHPKIINNLIYGWGNMGWSSFQNYTYAIINAAKQTNGPVLECGSGLSTLLMGIIAEDKGFEVWSLEHHESWAAHVKKHLAKMNIDKVKVCYAPLKSYGDYQWYDPKDINPPKDFSLVICDGPPHDTKGGRYGLLPLMHGQLADQAIILLDDYVRLEEKSIVIKWQNDFKLKVTECGDNDLYANIIYNKNQNK